ncbi:MAG TPA: mobile mystery protein B [Longimicrobium sp.]|nr:mobile mystery protein B [Longimicrobium sp.]
MISEWALPDGATPLDPEESEGLIPRHIATRAELNEAEEANIAQGFAWALRATRRRPVLSDDFAYELHRRMFERVWEWAGRTRTTNKNIGIDKFGIRVAVRDLMADAAVWIDGEVYPPEEIAVRLHHRLVAIHPFVNGNGRHARLMADLCLLKEKLRPLPWGRGRGSLVATGELRAEYISALRAADAGNIAPLLVFARS